MNCFYHPDRTAVMQCKNCKKGLCSECSTLFKSNLCTDCEKKQARKAISKSILTFLFSTILAVTAYIVFKRIDDIHNEFIHSILNSVLTFYKGFVTIFDVFEINVTENFKSNLAFILSIYFFSSVPFGYYALRKSSRYIISGSVIVTIIVVYLKILISCFIGPIVMPIALIICLMSLIKNIRRLLCACAQK